MTGERHAKLLSREQVESPTLLNALAKGCYRKKLLSRKVVFIQMSLFGYAIALFHLFADADGCL